MVRTRLVVLLLLALAACGGGDESTGNDSTGGDLAGEIGCFACHTDSDTDLAPTLEGIWGTEVTLEDGSTVTVDETYVRRSIMDPTSDIVEGYRGVMPNFSLSDSEVDRLVEWVESLG